MQRFKTHPAMRKHFEGGRRISYGARALNEGGLQSIPKLTFPGGALIGDAAGFLNVPKIKGTHTSMKSGMLAAEAVAEALADGRPAELVGLRRRAARQLGVATSCRGVRNVRPVVRQVRAVGRPRLFRGRHVCAARQGAVDLPPSAPRQRDAARGGAARAIDYPRPDGVLTFDRLSSVFISNTNHEENQPAHLHLRDPAMAITVNWERLPQSGERAIARRASTRSSAPRRGDPQLQINAQNCVHCKTCDIKDPTQNINWVTPEGGGGPNYPGGM